MEMVTTEGAGAADLSTVRDVTTTEVAGAPVVPTTPGRRSRWPTLLAAAGGYLLLSVVLWSSVWWHHPASTTTCGCGDASLFTWFLEWPAYALAHGHSPLFSGAMFHPTGVNLVANTGVLAIGVVLAPVTWLFGPIATLNVASTLAPVLSALAMFVLLRRWVAWEPAAFLGGLFYGFSPFILVSLTVAHLMLAVALVPPLVVLCLDDLLLRHEHRPVRIGVVLGLLVALQFFLSTELLLIMVVVVVIGVATLVVAGLRHRERLRWHARRAAPGLLAAAVTAVPLLAYPLWYALAGPAHLSGPIWPTGLSHQGGTVHAFLFPTPSGAGWLVWTRVVGQYQGPLLSDQYIGWGVAAVVAAGCIVWRRDRRLWYFGGLAVVALWLDLGSGQGAVRPWRAVAGLPLLQDIVPGRFVLMALLAIAVLLAIILDHVRAALDHRAGTGVVAALVVAVVALGPLAWYLRADVPVTTRPVQIPRWFATVAPRLPTDQVLLVLPTASVREAPLTWQAVERMPYVAATGSGPADDLSRAGRFARGEAVLYNASTAEYPQTFRPGDTEAVRTALHGWGVTTVVIPDQPGLPIYEQVTSVPFAVALITAATGRAPVREASAWAWYGLDRDPRPAIPVSTRLSSCTDRSLVGQLPTTRLGPCVLGVGPVGPMTTPP